MALPVMNKCCQPVVGPVSQSYTTLEKAEKGAADQESLAHGDNTTAIKERDSQDNKDNKERKQKSEVRPCLCVFGKERSLREEKHVRHPWLLLGTPY